MHLFDDRLSLTCAVLLTAATLSACGDDSSTDDGSTPSTTTGVPSSNDATTNGEGGGTTTTGNGGGTSSGGTTDEASSGTTAGDEDPSGDSTGNGIIFDVGGGKSETGGEGICDTAQTTLQATMRDFASTHVDMEVFWGGDASTGLVLPVLGADGTPDYNPAPPPPPPGSSPTQITSAASFAQWYHDTADINVAEAIDIELVEMPPGSGVYVFDDPTFFPLDGIGWNAAPGPNNETFPDTLGDQHNFHFTTEIHTSFVYEAGQVFTFIGDDDLWVFIDGDLAIDLGGLHGELEGSVDLDTLGLVDGATYDMDIFHAERRHNGSHFRVETSISCFFPPAG